MRLLLINRHYGGAQVPTGRMLADLTERLVLQGHSVEVFTSKSDYVSNAAFQCREGLNARISLAWTLGKRVRLVSWITFLVQSFFAVTWKRWDRCVFLTDPPFLNICAMAGN